MLIHATLAGYGFYLSLGAYNPVHDEREWRLTLLVAGRPVVGRRKVA